MDSLSDMFNNCGIAPTIQMDSIISSLNEINNDIHIGDIAVLTVVNWIRKNPFHCFPKRKKEWISTINGNLHLNRVRMFSIQNRRTNIYYIDGEHILDLLLQRDFLYQNNYRIYCNQQAIETQTPVFKCGKRKNTNIIERHTKCNRVHQ